MDDVTSLLDITRNLLPLLATIAAVGVLLALTHVFLGRRYGDYPQARLRIQLLLLCLTLIGIVAIVLVGTRDDSEMRGQLLSFLGILLSATIALSSTTFLGNVLAGFLLRVVAGFGIGDFIRVGEDFGRVTERGILHTEIQTEDRNLLTLPNLYLVSNPVHVVRSSGTIISATVSLGYDVSRLRIEQALVDAATEIGLEGSFVHILELGDFAVTYRISGLLRDVKQLLSARSALRAAALDSLHAAGIEIVSPNFMNTRALESGARVLPPRSQPQSAAEVDGATAAEDLAFDKADEAMQIEDLSAHRKQLEEEIDTLREGLKELTDESERAAAERRIEGLEATRSRLREVIERARAKADES